MDENKLSDFIQVGENQINDKLFIEAIVTFTTVILDDPFNIEALFGRATACKNILLFNQALEDLAKVEELQYKTGVDKKLYMLRGDIYMILKDYEKAIIEYDTFMALDPGMGEVYAMRGFAKKELGLIDSANIDFSRANELGHGSPSWMIK